MIKSILLALAAFTVTSQAVVSITLSGSPDAGPQFFSSNTGSGLVADGSVVRLGTFETAPAAGSTFAQLAAAFREFGRTTVGTDSTTDVDGDGRIQRSGIIGSSTADSPDPDSFFVGKTVYMWVYNGAVSDTTAQGVFASTAAQNTYVDQTTARSLSMSSFSALGRFDGAQGSESTMVVAGTTPSYRLAAPVPEPGVGILALASLGLLARRRRN